MKSAQTEARAAGYPYPPVRSATWNSARASAYPYELIHPTAQASVSCSTQKKSIASGNQTSRFRTMPRSTTAAKDSDVIPRPGVR